MDSAIITRYATQDATVTWRPHTCNHSGICLRGLPDVFDPPRRPSVDVTSADLVAFVAQVEQCPSGAMRERDTAFCRCGLSSSMPYGDGSPAAAGFQG